MSRRSFSVGGIGGGGSVVGRHGDFVRWRRGQRSEVLEALVPSACLLDSVLDIQAPLQRLVTFRCFSAEMRAAACVVAAAAADSAVVVVEVALAAGSDAAA